MPSPNPTVVLNRLSFAWPDGTPVLTAVDGVFRAERTGLVGANGVGNTTWNL